MIIDGALALVLKAILNAKGPISSSQIAYSVGISTSSVKSFVKALRPIIEQEGGRLEGKPSVGFELYGSKEFFNRIEYLLQNNVDPSYSFQERKKYILETLFNESPDYTIQLFADDLFVGKNRVVKDLDLINKWLFPFGVTIQKKRKYGLSLKGKEADIREAWVEHNQNVPLKANLDKKTMNYTGKLDERFSNRYYNAIKEIYGIKDFLYYQNLLKKAEQKLSKTFTKQSIRKILEYLLVSKNRSEVGCFLSCNEFDYDHTIISDFRDAASFLLKGFGIMENQYFANEVDRLAAIMSCLDLQTRNTIEITEKERSLYDRVAANLIENVKVVAHVGFRKTGKLKEKLIGLLAVLAYRHRFHVSFRSDMEKDVKSLSSNIFGATFTCLSAVSEDLSFQVTDSDAAVITMCLVDAMIEEDKIRAIFIGTNDYYSFNYVSKLFNERCKNLQIVERYSLTNWYSAKRPTADLILTDIPISSPDETPVIRIRCDSVEEAIDFINETVDEIRSASFNTSAEENNNRFFSSNLIVVNSPLREKEEIVRYGCQLLLKYGYIKKEFIEDALAAEINSPSALGHDVAMPHGAQDNILRSGLCMIQLKKPVLWTEEDKVSLVFITPFIIDDLQNSRKFSARFFSMLCNDEALAKLKHAESSLEANQILIDFFEGRGE